MGPKVKRATFIFSDDHILIECPICGMHMVKTDYKKIAKLLNETGTPRGRVCQKCGGVAVIKLNSEGRGKVVAKLAEYKDKDGDKGEDKEQGGEQNQRPEEAPAASE